MKNSFAILLIMLVALQSHALAFVVANCGTLGGDCSQKQQATASVTKGCCCSTKSQSVAVCKPMDTDSGCSQDCHIETETNEVFWLIPAESLQLYTPNGQRIALTIPAAQLFPKQTEYRFEEPRAPPGKLRLAQLNTWLL